MPSDSHWLELIEYKFNDVYDWLTSYSSWVDSLDIQDLASGFRIRDIWYIEHESDPNITVGYSLMVTNHRMGVPSLTLSYYILYAATYSVTD